jgi:hypothetical protein
MARETAMPSKSATRVQTPPQLCNGVDPPNGAAGANAAARPLPRQQRCAAGGARAYSKLMARLTIARRKGRSKVDKQCRAGGQG